MYHVLGHCVFYKMYHVFFNKVYCTNSIHYPFRHLLPNQCSSNTGTGFEQGIDLSLVSFGLVDSEPLAS